MLCLITAVLIAYCARFKPSAFSGPHAPLGPGQAVACAVLSTSSPCVGPPTLRCTSRSSRSSGDMGVAASASASFGKHAFEDIHGHACMEHAWPVGQQICLQQRRRPAPLGAALPQCAEAQSFGTAPHLQRVHAHEGLNLLLLVLDGRGVALQVGRDLERACWNAGRLGIKEVVKGRRQTRWATALRTATRLAPASVHGRAINPSERGLLCQSRAAACS